MGKKGSWLSALKRVFIPNSKEKVPNVTEKQGVKEKKKWGLKKSKHGETNTFIPLYREPSSIEKILGEAEKERQKTYPLPSPSPRGKVNSNPIPTANYHHVPSPPVNRHHISAIKIQTTYRGYRARRSFRALKGLVRLQGVMRGQNVKHQTMNAMRSMQLLVRVQSQIQLRRIQAMESQALQRQKLHMSDKEMESSVGRWTLTQPSENGQNEEWDDSLLTKEELEARMQRKVEAAIKRERALAYAYGNQLWKSTPRSAHAALTEIRSSGIPWWWNWLERQLPAQTPENQPARAKDDKPLNPRAALEASPLPERHRRAKFGSESLDLATPKSLKSSPATKTRKPTTPLSVKTPPAEGASPLKHAKPRLSVTDSSYGTPLRDDESLTSCPPFSVPNYMVPTVSAKAKVRTQSNHKERSTGPPPPPASSRESKRRVSFPFGQGTFGSLRWNKRSLFSSKDSNSRRIVVHDRDLSVDSTLSLPAGVGRQPFR